MPDPKQLPYLIQLLDDDSKVVKKAVLKELAAFGPSLEEELGRLPQPLTSPQRELLQKILEERNRDLLKKAWKKWLELDDDAEKLEAALGLIADFQTGFVYPVKLKAVLDRLSEEYLAAHAEADAVKLAHFLFQEKGIRGAAQEDYQNPFNSNLIFAVEKKQGLPITLACIFILVGRRLGLKIEGCNLPGHFLARAVVDGKTAFVDCFNGGRFLDDAVIDQMRRALTPASQEVLYAKVEAETIVSRVVSNLFSSYQQAENWANGELMTELREILDRERVG